jgi:hypothetical protein
MHHHIALILLLAECVGDEWLHHELLSYQNVHVQVYSELIFHVGIAYSTLKVVLPSFFDPGTGLAAKLQAAEEVVVRLVELCKGTVSFLSSMKLHASITWIGFVSDLKDLMSFSSLMCSMLLMRKKANGT